MDDATYYEDKSKIKYVLQRLLARVEKNEEHLNYLGRCSCNICEESNLLEKLIEEL